MRSHPGERTRGIVCLGSRIFPCALGRSGTAPLKREGDGATPLGAYTFRRALFRADRILRPRSGLPLTPIAPSDGWCDAPADPNYNRPISHPYPASAEHLWREDGLYDIVVVLSHNDRPRIRNRGSAVFLHLAREGFTPTAGCVALRRADLVQLLPHLTPRTRLRILP